MRHAGDYPMAASKLLAAAFALALNSSAFAAAEPEVVEHKNLMDHGGGHLMDMDGGMVMGQNKDTLPGGCDRVSEDVEFTVRAGHKYTREFPGTMFGFDKHEWRLKPCSRVTVHFINEDNVRHQWMVHGLPKYIYDKGMFHLEVTGPGKISGTLIVPKEDKTYLVHCDIAQHMEKGMKGQLVVGKGGGTFPTIPGITDPAIPDDYSAGAAAAAPAAALPAGPAASSSSAPAAETPKSSNGTFIIGMLLGLFGTPFLVANVRSHLQQGMSVKDIAGCFASRAYDIFDRVVVLVGSVLRNLQKK